MDSKLKIGLVIADEMEYVPMRGYSKKYGGLRRDFYRLEGHRLSLTAQSGKEIEVISVLSGIGMVNAAAATVLLAKENVDYIINTGLSGGVSGVSRGDITAGTKYIEHDFDLTPIGYEMGVKPGQNYIYKSDNFLLAHFKKVLPFIKAGAMVSGDCFVGDPVKRELLIERFGAVSCDMESAAVAYVCELADIGFIAIRCISDDAGDNAPDSYREMNDKAESALLDLVFEGITSI